MTTTTRRAATPLVLEPEASYTPAEAAKLLKASERQVRRWMTESRLGFSQRPRGRVVLGRQIIAFNERNAVEPEEA